MRGLSRLMPVIPALVLSLLAADRARGLRLDIKPGSAVFLRPAPGLRWDPHPRLPKGAMEHRLRPDPKTAAAQSILRLPARYAAPEHAHDGDATIVVIRGKLRVRGAGRDVVLKRGGFAVLPAGTQHALETRTWRGETWLAVTEEPSKEPANTRQSP
ncbi:MAG: cupin domain-containing protein [Elusimicrobiota bacterium]